MVMFFCVFIFNLGFSEMAYNVSPLCLVAEESELISFRQDNYFREENHKGT
jgi:hypothetical protein